MNSNATLSVKIAHLKIDRGRDDNIKEDILDYIKLFAMKIWQCSCYYNIV